MNREYATHIRCSATWRRSNKLSEQPSEEDNKNSWRYERGPSWRVGDRVEHLMNIESVGLVERDWTMGGNAGIDEVPTETSLDDSDRE